MIITTSCVIFCKTRVYCFICALDMIYQAKHRIKSLLPTLCSWRITSIYLHSSVLGELSGLKRLESVRKDEFPFTTGRLREVKQSRHVVNYSYFSNTSCGILLTITLSQHFHHITLANREGRQEEIMRMLGKKIRQHQTLVCTGAILHWLHF